MRLLSISLAALALAGPLGAQIQPTMVGHEFRQDDLPSIAASPDGSMWLAWLSFEGSRDDVVIRRHAGGKWENLQWVPNTSGDSWAPQVGVDASSRPWAVWTQQVNGNFDIYARRYDPGKQEWGAMERLSSDPLPDIYPRVACDGKGRVAVVWQGFRGKNSNIFARVLNGDSWGPEIRVTHRAANDWEPAIAFGGNGELHVVYDTYKNGNYDVSLARIANGAVANEMTVASSARFEARPTVAVDPAGRVWVAWEEGQPGWGKDQGYILRANPKGVPLGGYRRPRVRCLDGGQWRDVAPLSAAFPDGLNTYQPHVFSDGRGSVWVVAKTRYVRRIPTPANPNAQRGYWQYGITHLEGAAWSKLQLLPGSEGRSSTRMSAALDKDAALWAAWDGDGRVEKFHHKPVRQQIFAAKLAVPRSVAPSWTNTSEPASTPATMGHANEAADVKTIRDYRIKIGGKPHQIVRGDFHRHTELSWDGGGVADGSLQDFYRYMIDAGAMDFGGSTDHQGGAWPYWWWYTLKMTDMHNVPGAYVAYYGYERSAVFPNGHRNTFFVKRSDAKVTPFHMRAGFDQFALGRSPMGDEPGIGSGDLAENDTKLLYEEIRNRNAVTISHTSGTRMGTDWRDNDPDLEPVVEIFQGARTSYEQLGAPYVAAKGRDDQHMGVAGYQPEGMMTNAWGKGYKLGIITSSDHGSTHISYALVYTDNPTRQGILDGIRKRHTYGATDNIVLEVWMGNHFMGDEFQLGKAAPIKVKARGTGTVATVEVIKDSKVIYTAQPKKQDVGFEFIDKDSVAGRHYYYVRLMQDDGMIAWSSPFFINYK